MIDIRVCQISGWPNRTIQIPFHSTLLSYGLWNFQSFTLPFISQLTQLLFCASCSNTLTHREVQCGWTTSWFEKVHLPTRNYSEMNTWEIGFWFSCLLPFCWIFLSLPDTFFRYPGCLVPELFPPPVLDNTLWSGRSSSPECLFDLTLHLLRVTLSFSDSG